MNNRERSAAILHYRDYDRLPVVHFGFWPETLVKWCEEGHVTDDEAKLWNDGNQFDNAVASRLGFDFNWYSCTGGITGLFPLFESKVVGEFPDGSIEVLNGDGMIVVHKPGIVSIQAEVDHLLKDRAAWEEHYLPRLRYSEDRVDSVLMEELKRAQDQREKPLGIHCGSLFGQIRNWIGVEGISYLYADDEELYGEIIDTVGELCFKVAEKVLSSGVEFDFGHFWEDICFKNGPLVKPSVFNEKVGPHYRRITKLLGSYGIDIVSLDCDGLIDSLIPTWFENGVNTMFPIEVGTWNASIVPWREKYGRELRGVGGMDKKVFAYDYSAVDAEIERLKPLAALGGYIPCPDHRIAPDAKWENVQYYCDKMHKAFG